MVENLPANAGDMGSMPGSVRSPGEGNGNPFQYSCLGNPIDMDRGAWGLESMGLQKCRTELSNNNNNVGKKSVPFTTNVGDDCPSPLLNPAYFIF